jgi:hypothetical protein
LLAAHELPFAVKAAAFDHVDEAKAFVIQLQRERRSLGRLAESYYRGLLYNQQKQGHGGARAQKISSSQNDNLKTGERLGQQLGVSEATISRDGDLYDGVESIVTNCGDMARRLLLMRNNGLTHAAVLELAEQTAKLQRRFLKTLEETGKAPRSPSASATEKGFRVPATPHGILKTLQKRVKIAHLRDIWVHLGVWLQEQGIALEITTPQGMS